VSFGTATWSLHDDLAIVRIENPEARNALDDGARKALLHCLQEATQDVAVLAVVLTGSDTVFCAGGDLRSMPTEPDLIRARLGEMHAIVRLLHAGPKPTVAAVEGVAFGSGLSMATACDHVVIGAGARFGCTFGRVGLIADTGLNAVLPLRVGSRVARRILLGQAVIGDDDAVAMGLADELAFAGTALAVAIDACARWRGVAPLALAGTRRLLAAGLDAALAAELEAQIELLGGVDFDEGRRAFFERRTPAFSGRS
jgi:enoyl-CoA hydratase/carnithine racemase